MYSFLTVNLKSNIVSFYDIDFFLHSQQVLSVVGAIWFGYNSKVVKAFKDSLGK